MFDSVPHEQLLKKVEALEIEDDALQWIRDWAAVKSGIPQGNVLGPVLFVAFINGLLGAVSSMCAMYVDDTKVHGPVNNSKDGDKLQKDLDALVNWADTWQLHFNTDKCTSHGKEQ